MVRSTRNRRSPKRTSPVRQLRQARRGAAVVEFAIVAPVFFLLVFGLIEVGRMMMIRQSLTNAAREGCRAAVLATTTNSSKVDAAVRGYLQSITSKATDSNKVRVTAPSGLASCASGTGLTVSVEVDYEDVTWLPFAYLGLHPTIGAQQTGQRE